MKAGPDSNASWQRNGIGNRRLGNQMSFEKRTW